MARLLSIRSGTPSLKSSHRENRVANGSVPMTKMDAATSPAPPGGELEVFAIFLRLGLTCFGGPIAHIGYFRDEFVVRRKWLDEAAYADLVALCQFLPGPA